MSSKSRLILTVGLPRSGKSTWARTHSAKNGMPIVNPDSIRLAIHGQRFIPLAEPFVWLIAKVMVRALFLTGHHEVILDATNTTRARRAEWFDANWERDYVVMTADEATCLARAESDEAIIPIIRKMAASFEPLQSDEVDGACVEGSSHVGQ